METVAGVFRDSAAAQRAAADLLHTGFAQNQVNLLLPGAAPEEIRTVPASETEQPGMGGAIGGVVGAALGIAGGFEFGVGVTALIPGVGPVMAFGVAAAALLGAGGAAVGAMLGEAAEERTTGGVPSDEILFYEDALRQGRSLVFVLARSRAEAKRARRLLGAAGAESLDAAREDWWLGLRDAEDEHYRAMGQNFQDAYRTGFDSAMRRECQGNSFAEAEDQLKWLHPKMWDTEAFRRGFERGLEYRDRQGVTAPGGAGR